MTTLKLRPAENKEEYEHSGRSAVGHFFHDAREFVKSSRKNAGKFVQYRMDRISDAEENPDLMKRLSTRASGSYGAKKSQADPMKRRFLFMKKGKDKEKPTNAK
jgi:hypothetical protein